jgi:hypothetical protein
MNKKEPKYCEKSFLIQAVQSSPGECSGGITANGKERCVGGDGLTRSTSSVGSTNRA